MIISPSILSADFCNLKNDIDRVSKYVKWLHVDVMDGHFVPNISIGVPVVKSIRKATDLFLDTHLMIEDPDFYIEPFYKAGSDLITFHYEAAEEKTPEIIKKIKSYNLKAGISIKPNTSLEAIINYIDMVDLILIMTVEPGFGGQKFIEECAYKINDIKNSNNFKNNPNLIIQADGGINSETAKICKNLGYNSLVAGSYIYNSDNIEKAIESLK